MSSFADDKETLDYTLSKGEEKKAILNKMAPYSSEPPKLSVYELVCKIDPNKMKK